MRLVLGPAVAAALLALLAPAPEARAQVMPDIPPAPYAGEMLPASPSHPWVMVPRQGIPFYTVSGLSYGYRTSPYGDYSRFAYYRTGPFPALPRASLRHEAPPSHYKWQPGP
jgi:hypothetical protein